MTGFPYNPWVGGAGAPKAIIEGVALALPRPSAGGRKEEWKAEVDEVWTTLAGERIQGDRRFRFTGEYRFPQLTYAQAVELMDAYNRQISIHWRPYMDVPSLRIWCRIVELVPEKAATVNQQDVFTLKLEALALVDSIPVVGTDKSLAQHPLTGVPPA